MDGERCDGCGVDLEELEDDEWRWFGEMILCWVCRGMGEYDDWEYGS